MAAPTKAERQSDELLKTLIDANTRMVEAMCQMVASMTPAPAVVKQAARVNVEPAIRFEDIPEDDWDKPERLWKREEEEDAEHLAGLNGMDVDPEFMAAVLKEANIPNPEVT